MKTVLWVMGLSCMGLLNVFSAFAMAPEGLAFKNVSTASREYRQSANNSGDAELLKTNFEKTCNKDKKEAEDYIVKTLGAKILTNTGCVSAVSGPKSEYDYPSVSVHTSFSIQFR